MLEVSGFEVQLRCFPFSDLSEERRAKHCTPPQHVMGPWHFPSGGAGSARVQCAQKQSANRVWPLLKLLKLKTKPTPKAVAQKEAESKAPGQGLGSGLQ